MDNSCDKHVDKKIKVASNGSEGVVEANKIITLNFHEDSPVAAQPVYSHQLFDNEEIAELSPGQNHKIYIDINCINLSHIVSYSSNITPLQMKLISEKLTAALPTNTKHTINEDPIHFDATEYPEIGKVIHKFSRYENDFEVRLATFSDAGASELLNRAEKLAMWYIETADSVDFSDERWEALFLFRVESNTEGMRTSRRWFVGHFTLFTFNNPFQGSRLRVCQALITPPHQGSGLGREMLLSVYRLVAEREGTVEVTVEDPAPAFQRLRDNVDYEWYTLRVSDAAQMDMAALSKVLKITKQQAAFVAEAQQYVCMLDTVRRAGGQSGALESSAEFKQFRLAVKQRLFKADKELRHLARAAMQEELGTLFETQMDRFRALHNTAERLGRLALIESK